MCTPSDNWNCHVIKVHLLVNLNEVAIDTGVQVASSAIPPTKSP